MESVYRSLTEEEDQFVCSVKLEQNLEFCRQTLIAVREFGMNPDQEDLNWSKIYSEIRRVLLAKKLKLVKKDTEAYLFMMQEPSFTEN